ncbi:MAG: peptidase T [Gaiellaceae bacterium]
MLPTENLAVDALERFLRYVRIDTQSAEDSETFPSTAKQLDLSRLLVEELQALGIDDARLDANGYVLASIPATVEHEVPALGLIAHVDTSPSVSGTDVKPVVHEHYDGGRLELPGDPRQVLDPTESPELARHAGHSLVTSDGTTLLGADDKAGVAEIMATAAYLVAHPELPHGPIKIGFTPDEEVGNGALHFDLEAFGAAVAITADGSTAGEIQDETFSALQAKVTFTGVNIHPGLAKGQLLNAIKLAADLVAALPRDALSPETTEERGGFLHPVTIEGDAGEVRLTLILRDFDDEKLAGHEALLRRLAAEVAATDPRARVAVDVRRQYTNMKRFLDEYPRLMEAAREAIRRVGLEPITNLIRGGTDGSRLTELGLPTPNLFTGGHEYHSEREWICVEDMGLAAAAMVELARVWAEPDANRA